MKNLISLKKAEEIIHKIKKSLHYFSGKKKYYLAYTYIMKSYISYDKKFFYQKLKPYIQENKKSINLIEESWVKENKEYKKIKKEIEEKEKFRFIVICGSDSNVWENTYGTTCPFTKN